MRINIELMAKMAVFVAIGTIGSQLLWFPAGVAKAYPVQHAVNVMSAVLLGPGPAVGVAFMIGLLRNMLGLGSLLAFPGGMIGAYLAGFLYRRFGKKGWAMFGEIMGSGVIGALFAVPVSRLLMGTSVGAVFFIPSFLISSISGAVIGLLVLSRVSTPELDNT